MPFNLSSATRFAGDHLGTAYSAFDGKIGGFLPGGTGSDGVGLVKDVARDILPGRRQHGETASEKAKGTAGDLATGRVDLAATRARSARAGGKAREHLVEEVAERIGRRAINRATLKGPLYSLPIAGQAMAAADTVMDTMSAYDTVVEVATGKGYGQHVDDTIAMRNDGRTSTALFPEAKHVGDDIHTISQATETNPILQEIGNRATRASQNFNPLKGDWGVSEVMGWN